MDDIRPPARAPVVAIVGMSYSGLPLAILAASRGYRVVAFDGDEVKIAQLHKRETAFLSDEQNTQFKDAQHLRLTHDSEELAGADIYIIAAHSSSMACAGPDLDPILYACSVIGPHLDDRSLIIVESTVHPGTCEQCILPALEKTSKRARDAIHLAHAPIPLDNKALGLTPRVVGGHTETHRDAAADFYAALVDAKIIPMRSLQETEAVTLLSHAIGDINAALVNELAIGFDTVGIDIVNVINAASMLPHPLHSLPSCQSGHRLDSDHLMYGERRFEYRFLTAARRINATMPLYAVKLLDIELQKRNEGLEDAHVALLGLTKSEESSDLRGSPALAIHRELERRGARVRTFDPHAPAASSARTLRQALDGADAALIAADHPQFRSLTPRHFEELAVGIVVDGTNTLDKDAFTGSAVKYRGIGRSD